MSSGRSLPTLHRVTTISPRPSAAPSPHRAGANFLCYVTPAEHLRLPDGK